jgi:hypothetical protein
MQATLGADVVATLVAPGVLPAAEMGARIEVPYTRAIVAYWRPAAYDPVTGLWTVVLESPVAAGDYQLVWRTSDPEPPELEVMIPLTVSSSTAAPVDPVTGLPPWAPSLEEIAEVTPAYTRGGFDDDSEEAGAEHGTFDESTSPTAPHVEGLIKAACEEVAGRVGVPIQPARYGLAKAAAKWHVAAMVAAGKMPGGTDDASGEYRSHIANFRASLDELVRLARMGGTRLR